jgi:hypothetical protein
VHNRGMAMWDCQTEKPGKKICLSPSNPAARNSAIVALRSSRIGRCWLNIIDRRHEQFGSIPQHRPRAAYSGHQMHLGGPSQVSPKSLTSFALRELEEVRGGMDCPIPERDSSLWTLSNRPAISNPGPSGVTTPSGHYGQHSRWRPKPNADRCWTRNQIVEGWISGRFPSRFSACSRRRLLRRFGRRATQGTAAPLRRRLRYWNRSRTGLQTGQQA